MEHVELQLITHRKNEVLFRRTLILFVVMPIFVLTIAITAFAQDESVSREENLTQQAHRGSSTINDIIPATAEELALAMGVPSSDLVSADLMGSDPAGVGVSNSSLGEWFPTEGGTFALLTTGLAADATLPNDEENLSSELGGLNSMLGEDLVRLHLELEVPDNINCASFDFAYYSDDYN